MTDENANEQSRQSKFGADAVIQIGTRFQSSPLEVHTEALSSTSRIAAAAAQSESAAENGVVPPAAATKHRSVFRGFGPLRCVCVCVCVRLDDETNSVCVCVCVCVCVGVDGVGTRRKVSLSSELQLSMKKIASVYWWKCPKKEPKYGTATSAHNYCALVCVTLCV